MILQIEQEYQADLGFAPEAAAEKVLSHAFSRFEIPYETSVTLLLVSDEEIRRVNAAQRQIDKATDVLSFPAMAFAAPGVLPAVEEHPEDYFDPENDSLYLGDIMLSLDHVLAQAEAYGHSVLREFAFLLTHSALHLMGYDHMEPAEEQQMFQLQRKILEELEIRA